MLPPEILDLIIKEFADDSPSSRKILLKCTQVSPMFWNVARGYIFNHISVLDAFNGLEADTVASFFLNENYAITPLIRSLSLRFSHRFFLSLMWPLSLTAIKRVIISVLEVGKLSKMEIKGHDFCLIWPTLRSLEPFIDDLLHMPSLRFLRLRNISHLPVSILSDTSIVALTAMRMKSAREVEPKAVNTPSFRSLHADHTCPSALFPTSLNRKKSGMSPSDTPRVSLFTVFSPLHSIARTICEAISPYIRYLEIRLLGGLGAVAQDPVVDLGSCIQLESFVLDLSSYPFGNTEMDRAFFQPSVPTKSLKNFKVIAHVPISMMASTTVPVVAALRRSLEWLKIFDRALIKPIFASIQVVDVDVTLKQYIRAGFVSSPLIRQKNLEMAQKLIRQSFTNLSSSPTISLRASTQILDIIY